MPAERKLRVLIVDDEPLARKRLEILLSGRTDTEIVGRAKNGQEAIEAIRRLRPDLVFLDVQMAKVNGLEVVREISPERMPTTIFVTAYDQYTLKAFEVAALDYLLKPFSDQRFEESLERARKTVHLQRAGELTSKLFSLLQQEEDDDEEESETKKESQDYVSRLAVELRGQVLIIPVETIDFITASDSYAELHVGQKTHVIREKMHKLETRLNPDQFFRIHRSTIVRLDTIDALLCHTGGDYAVRLKDGRYLKVGRGRRTALEQRLGMTL